MTTPAPAAKFATPLTPGLVNFGECVALTAAHLGTPLMPWQRQVADVITQLDPLDPRRWRYDIAIVTVPRQSGKSTLIRALSVDRILRYNGHQVLMTAQTGKDARKRWAQIIEVLGAKKKPNHFTVRQSQGSERLEYKRRGSFIAPFAPTPKSVHGDTVETFSIDEVWAFDSAAGAELLAAIKPAQITLPNSQLWAFSTLGTSASGLLNDLIDQGRKSLTDPTSRIAFFEWSADEEKANADPFSDETLSFHPALGHTLTADDIRSQFDGNLANFRRGMLNLPTSTTNTAIDLAIWGGLVEPGLEPGRARYAVGYAVSNDGSEAVIYAAWVRGDGDVCLAPLATAPGRAWLADALADLSDSGVTTIVGSNDGPSRTAYDDMRDELPSITCLSPGQYGTACQAFLDRVAAGELSHTGDPALVAAIERAHVRPYGGVKGFDEARSDGSIAALKAATLAMYGATNLQPARLLIA